MAPRKKAQRKPRAYERSHWQRHGVSRAELEGLILGLVAGKRRQTLFSLYLELRQEGYAIISIKLAVDDLLSAGVLRHGSNSRLAYSLAWRKALRNQKLVARYQAKLAAAKEKLVDG